MTSLVIRNVRLDGGTDAVDVHVHGGTITAIRPHSEDAPSGPSSIDGQGGIVLPGLVDAHAHLDKTTWGLPYRRHTAGPTLEHLTENERDNRGQLGADVEQRAAALLEQCMGLGTTHLRTHVDVDTELGLASVEGVAAAAAKYADSVTVEIVAFPQSGLVRRPGTADLLDAAMRAGATVVGGIDPAGFDGDPIRHLDIVFDLAERHAAPLDIHLHDGGELGAWEMEVIAERTQALGMEDRVVISHAFALATVSEAQQGRLVELLARAGISVATTAPGRHAMLPIRLLREHGVGVCCGNDGVRDLWGPYGNGDLLERAMLLAYRCGFRRDEDIELAIHAATTGGADALGLGLTAVEVGCPADLVVVPGETRVDAVMRHELRTAVVKAGRLVAGRAEPCN